MPHSADDRPADAGRTSIFIAGVQALDHSGSFTGPVDVSVVDGRVAGVGRGLRPARDQRRLDGHGLWLLPGIFDCHLHAGLASFDQLELMRTPLSRRVLETAHTLRRTLAAGVTSVRDAGIADAGIRDAVAAGLVPGPELQVSVVALGTTGGRGDGFRLGRIAPGYQFDAVLLDEDPADPAIFTRPGCVTGVFQRGVPVVPHSRLADLAASGSGGQRGNLPYPIGLPKISVYEESRDSAPVARAPSAAQPLRRES